MIGYLLSIFGLFTLLLGAVLWFVLPILPAITGKFKRVSGFYLWLMARVLKRGAFILSEHGDILLKQMVPDDRGVEIISFSTKNKAFEDPDNASHYWAGIRWALADEVHGLLFDPRHAAVGKQKHKHEQADEMVSKATASERKHYDGVKAWIRGVFAIPETHDVLRLGYARELVTGIERAEHPETVEEFVKLSRDPYKKGTGTMKIIVLLAAIIGPFLILGLLSGQMGKPDSTISFGVLALLLSTTGLPDADYKGILASIAGLLLALVPLGIIAYLTSPLTALWFVLTLALGFVLMTFVIGWVLGKAMTERLAGLLLKLGLLGYTQPVLEWTASKYRLREYNELDLPEDHEPAFYGIAGTQLGFTYTPKPDSFKSVHVENVDAKGEVMADGGPSTNLPVGHERYPEQRRAAYAGFVPEDTKDGHFYINTGVALEAFTNAAVGIKSHRFLTRAKEKFGGDDGISDKTFLYGTLGAGLISFITGVFVFFLL